MCYALKGNYTRYKAIKAAQYVRLAALQDARWTAAMVTQVKRHLTSMGKRSQPCTLSGDALERVRETVANSERSDADLYKHKPHAFAKRVARSVAKGGGSMPQSFKINDFLKPTEPPRVQEFFDLLSRLFMKGYPFHILDDPDFRRLIEPCATQYGATILSRRQYMRSRFDPYVAGRKKEYIGQLESAEVISLQVRGFPF